MKLNERAVYQPFVLVAVVLCCLGITWETAYAQPPDAPLPALRARLEFGERLALAEDDSRGAQQLGFAGYERPSVGLIVGGLVELRTLPWLFVGLSAGTEQAGGDRAIDGRTWDLDVWFADIVVTPWLGYFDMTDSIQFGAGIRLRAGVGWVLWSMNESTEFGVAPRVGAELDVAYTWKSWGLAARVGYAWSRVGGMGPLSLDFAFDGMVVTIGIQKDF